MKKLLTGVVISDKMVNTVVVRIERKFRHPLYKKVVKNHKNYSAHCEMKDVKVGDQVTIQSTRPISKTKNFIVISKIES